MVSTLVTSSDHGVPWSELAVCCCCFPEDLNIPIALTTLHLLTRVWILSLYGSGCRCPSNLTRDKISIDGTIQIQIRRAYKAKTRTHNFLNRIWIGCRLHYTHYRDLYVAVSLQARLVQQPGKEHYDQFGCIHAQDDAMESWRSRWKKNTTHVVS